MIAETVTLFWRRDFFLWVLPGFWEIHGAMLSLASGDSTRRDWSASAWFQPRGFAVTLAMLSMATFPDVIFGDRTFFYRDFGIFGYPIAYHHRESFWSGGMPLWNPFNNSGIPFLAQWNTMVLYPLSLVYLLFPLAWSLGVFCLLHLCLAGFGMYFLARQWTGLNFPAAVAGIVFAFNGLTLSCLKWPNNIAALAWMPWVVWLVERGWRQGGRSLILAGLVGATQMLSGGPEIILFTWAVLTILWVAEILTTFRNRNFSAHGSVSSPPEPSVGGGMCQTAPAASSDTRTQRAESDAPYAADQGEIILCPAHQTVTSHGSDRSRTWSGAPSKTRIAGQLALRFSAAIALVAGLSSAQLFPFLELLAHSQRGAAYSDASWSMPSWGWANFLVPLFHCFPSHQGVFAQPGQYWISSYYAGIGVLALAGAALWPQPSRRAVLLVATLMLGLLLSLGPAGYLYLWARELLPAFEIVRFPIKFVVVANFLLPIVAALGVARLVNFGNWAEGSERASDRTPRGPSDSKLAGSTRRSTKIHALLLCIGAVLLTLIGVIVWLARISPLPTDQWTSTVQSGLSRSLFLVAILGALAVLFSKQQFRPRPILGLGILFLLGIDATTHAPRLNPVMERWVYEPGLTRKELALNPEPNLGHSRAMISPFAESRLNHLALTNAAEDFLYSRMSLFANVNLLDRIPKVDGFYSLSIREEDQVRSLLYATTNSSWPNLERFLGVSQVSADDKPISWNARSNYLAFATAGQRPIFVKESDALRLIGDPAFDPARTVYLPIEAQGHSSTTNWVKAKVRVTQVSAHRISIEVEAPEATWMVLAQSYYNAWKAYLDGNRTRLWRANHAFQAIAIPEGRRTVQLVYEDRLFRVGSGISALTLLACAVFWIRSGPTDDSRKPARFSRPHQRK